MASQQNDGTNNNNQPGLIAGHAQYVKGVAEAAIGSVTGSHAWTSSGEQDKAQAASTMKAAGERRDPATSGYGKIEETAGNVLGCDGMKSEGAARTGKEDDGEIRRA